jgi:feruloyl-CoA synthase
VRVAGIAALAPLAQDIVVAGHNADEVRFLVFPNVAACRALAKLQDDANLADVLNHDAVRAAVAQGLSQLKQKSGGASSAHATRALLMIEPPSVDGGEITDKGYINQRAVLSRRASELVRLNADAPRDWIGCGP